jgi:cytochrome c oxidase subunit III
MTTPRGSSSMDAPLRPTIDVSSLPDVSFGQQNLVWWGTLGFVVIEGFTLAMCAVVWIYLAQSMGQWPPYGTPRPTLMASTILVVAMLLSLLLMRWIRKAARRYDYARTRLGVTIATLVCTIFVSLRMVELTRSLHVWWDTNAYGSAQWLILGAHGTLLLMQLVEMGGIALAFWFGNIEKKHFSDADDAVFYWYFMVAAWIPLYGLCFLVPRFA